MSAIDELNAFLRKSPSCIEPWEIHQYLSAIEAENAKMRDERDRMYKANVEKNGEILRLLEENAKLRKLVKEALMANKGGTFWEYFDPYSFWASWRKDAHELGIEVPDA